MSTINRPKPIKKSKTKPAKKPHSTAVSNPADIKTFRQLRAYIAANREAVYAKARKNCQEILGRDAL